jgi:hypothetical protein
VVADVEYPDGGVEYTNTDPARDYTGQIMFYYDPPTTTA